MNRRRPTSSAGLTLLTSASALALLIGPRAGKAAPPTPTEADTAAARAPLRDAWERARARPDDGGSAHAIELHMAGVQSERHWVSLTTARLR